MTPNFVRKKTDVKKIIDILSDLCIIDSRHTGEVRLHVAEGSLVSYEVIKKGKFKDLMDNR